MKPNRHLSQKHIGMLNVSFILVLLCSSMLLQAQTPTSFSGKWEFDTTKSSPGLLESTYGGTVIRQITQNPSTITFFEIWKKPGNADFKTANASYALDGKERIKKNDIGTRRSSAKWSQDKRILTITNRDTQTLKGVAQDFLNEDSYTLSSNGRILTIEQYSKNPVTGETRSKKVYNKK